MCAKRRTHGVDRGKSRAYLSVSLAETGADLLVEILPKYLNGEVEAREQPGGATYAPKIDKKESRIDWNKSAAQILRLINGCDPFPKAYTVIENKNTNLFSPEIVEDDSEALPGTVLSADKSGLLVKCGEDSIKIKEIQKPGKKRMEIGAYLIGNALEPGTILE